MDGMTFFTCICCGVFILCAGSVVSRFLGEHQKLRKQRDYYRIKSRVFEGRA